MKFLKDKQTRHDFVTYAMCLVAFAIVFFMQSNHMIPRMIAGQLVPITAYIVMAISLNLVVGIAGDLSLGHAGFMSVGAFTGVTAAVALSRNVDSGPVLLIVGMIVGALFAALVGFLIGILFYARSNVSYLFGDTWAAQTAYKILALIMMFVGGLTALFREKHCLVQCDFI